MTPTPEDRLAACIGKCAGRKVFLIADEDFLQHIREAEEAARIVGYQEGSSSWAKGHIAEAEARGAERKRQEILDNIKCVPKPVFDKGTTAIEGWWEAVRRILALTVLQPPAPAVPAWCLRAAERNEVGAHSTALAALIIHEEWLKAQKDNQNAPQT